MGSGNGKIGDMVAIPVTLHTGGVLRALSCTIHFDSSVVASGESSSTSIRDAGATVGSGVACRRKWATDSVTLQFTCSNTIAKDTVATIPLKVIGVGTSSLTVTNVMAYDGTMQPITAITGSGRVVAR